MTHTNKFHGCRGLCLLTLCLSLLAAAQGCSRFHAERVPKMKWLVMPFEQPQAQASAPRVVRGWWLGASTIRQNPRAGAMLSDLIAQRMAKLDYVNLFSSLDLKYYFADKRDLLKKEFKHLSDEEVTAALAQVPPLDYARELGADKMISGRIIENYMGENRTIHWWWSVVEFDVQVVDVATGKVEWSGRYRERDQFASQGVLQEELVGRVMKDLQDQYFFPLTRP